mmetsp:Transcript_41346/g.105184  ORF Transcript_41346/g.105184 Transcript_41346/m.105184 type:complete len:694 (+) Transcript_41346:132-2213(+)|eukprot:CAMPEP_0115180712 /NCGR_PEP_ID=MMETSP0270-20121206/7061_1 /TAXON_ID=71861 /ORGANISM="Scrippsiella trochoidea, Strain CCMP3099" /LENGTH=693 /DNA_ID=CAMNT_0002593721 /DNA_START=38 /DNA_END=2119 /DNA_ORIENTATION=+
MCSLEDLQQELETQLGKLKDGLKHIVREELHLASALPNTPWLAAAAVQPFQQRPGWERSRGFASASTNVAEERVSRWTTTTTGGQVSAASFAQGASERSSKSRGSVVLPDLSSFSRLTALVADDPSKKVFARHRRGYMAGKELYERRESFDGEDLDSSLESPKQRRQMTFEFNSEGEFGSGVRMTMQRTVSSLGSSSNSRGSSGLFGLGPLQASDEHPMERARRILGACVVSTAFELTSALLIIMNVVVLGIEAESMARSSAMASSLNFRLAERFFCIAFSIEVLLRIFVQRLEFFKGYEFLWNMLDLIAILLQIADIVGDEVLLAMADGSIDNNSTVMPGTNTVRIIRIFKLARIVIVLRSFRYVKELRTIIISLVGTMRTLIWTGVLLLVVIYIVAVSLTQVVTYHLATVESELERSALQKHFGSVGRAVLVLFQAISNGIDWDEMVDPLMRYISPWLAVPICLYVVFGIFALMNIVTGVFVESAMESGKKEKERFLLHTVRRLFQATDNDHSGDISWKEFKQKLQHPDMRAYFKIIDVDIDEAEDLFKLIDIDDSGAIDPEEFVNGCVRLQGPAKAIDLATLMHEYKQGLKREVTWHKAIAEAFAVLLQATKFARESLCMGLQEQAGLLDPRDADVFDNPSDEKLARSNSEEPEELPAVPEEGPSSGPAPALAGRSSGVRRDFDGGEGPL